MVAEELVLGITALRYYWMAGIMGGLAEMTEILIRVMDVTNMVGLSQVIHVTKADLIDLIGAGRLVEMGEEFVLKNAMTVILLEVMDVALPV